MFRKKKVNVDEKTSSGRMEILEDAGWGERIMAWIVRWIASRPISTEAKITLLLIGLIIQFGMFAALFIFVLWDIFWR